MREAERVIAAVRESGRHKLVGSLVGLVLMIVVVAGLIGAAFASERAGNVAEASRLFVGLAATAAAVAVFFLGFLVNLRFRARSLARRLALLQEGYPDGVALLLHQPRLVVNPGAPADWDAARPISVHAVVVQCGSIALLKITDRLEIVAQAHDATVTVLATTRDLHGMTFAQFTFRVLATGLDAVVEGIPAATKFSVPAVVTLDEFLTAARTKLGPSPLAAT